MTSPNRETEAQQVKAGVEQRVHTKVKARLRVKRGTIGVNLELGRIITDQEQQEKVMLTAADHQETEREAASNQEKVTAATSDQEQEEMAMLTVADHQETEKEAVLNQEKVIASDREQEKTEREAVSNQGEKAIASDQEQEEMAMPKISKADQQETERKAAINQERVIVSGLKAREVQEALQASSPAHSKKAVLKKCQEMKAAVM